MNVIQLNDAEHSDLLAMRMKKQERAWQTQERIFLSSCSQKAYNLRPLKKDFPKKTHQRPSQNIFHSLLPLPLSLLLLGQRSL